MIDPNCKYCSSVGEASPLENRVRKNGFLKPTKRHPDRPQIQRYRCDQCGRSFIWEDVKRSIGDEPMPQVEYNRRYMTNPVKFYPD